MWYLENREVSQRSFPDGANCEIKIISLPRVARDHLARLRRLAGIRPNKDEREE